MSRFDPEQGLARGRALLRRIRLFVVFGVLLYGAWFFLNRPTPPTFEYPDAPDRPYWLQKRSCADVAAGRIPESGWVRVEGCRVWPERAAMRPDGLWLALWPEETESPATVVGRFPADRKLLTASISGGDLEASVFELSFDAYLPTMPLESVASLSQLRVAESPVVLVAVDR